MTSIVIFAISGLAIVSLVTTKSLSERRKRPFFILNLISKGDLSIREFYHRTVRFYFEGKKWSAFFIKRQVPIHSKNSFNKFVIFLKDKKTQYLGDMRDSRLLKKSDGISEFFKNMSSIEKGNGVIHDDLETGSQEAEKELE